MKVLITGGAGFIGSAFVRILSRTGGFKLTILDSLTYAGDKSRIRGCRVSSFYNADIRDHSKLDRIIKNVKPDVVYNFAAHTHVDRSIIDSDEFVTTNIYGTHNLLKLSHKHKIPRYIQVSTDEVYGELGKTGKFKESTSIKPNSPYSASKASADHLVQAFSRTYGINTVIVRCCNNYGPWQYPEKFIPVIIHKTLANEKVPVYGKGTNVREWIYVDDFAQALLCLIQESKESVYNVGSGEELKNLDLVRMILNLMNESESLIEYVNDRPGHDLRYAIDSTRFRAEFKWKPRVNFESGLKRTVDWYIKHDSWVRNKLSELNSLWKKVYSQ